MPTLKDIVERNDIRTGRIFDLSVQLLIVLSLVAYSLETLPMCPRGPSECCITSRSSA